MKTCQSALQQKNTIRVVFSTKSGWPRDVYIINPQKALQVINNVLDIIAQHKDKLINKTELKQIITHSRN